MKNIEQLLNNYYETINEDERLIKDKAHSIEFLTTVRYVEKYLKPNDKILEVGAGTGRYSIYFAQKGFDVNAVELVNSNLSVLKNKITDNMKINAIEGNALNLSMYKDNSFDVVLLLGPLYHLFSKQDKKQAIREAVRVAKIGGKIFMAYITNDTVILSECLRKGNLSKLNEYCNTNDGYRVKENPKQIFSVNYTYEFPELLKNFPITTLHQVASDGIAPNMQIYINKLNDKEFKLWLDYHFATCERRDLLSYSSHILYICEKENKFDMDKYLNFKHIDLKKYLNDKDFKLLSILGIKVENRLYSQYDFDEIIDKELFAYYKNEQTIDNERKIKPLPKEVSFEEYDSLYKKMEGILEKI